MEKRIYSKCPYCGESNTQTQWIDSYHRVVGDLRAIRVYQCKECSEVYSYQSKDDIPMDVYEFMAQDYAYYNTGRINQETMR